MKNLQIALPESTHRQLKMAAAARGVTMKALVKEVIDVAIEHSLELYGPEAPAPALALDPATDT